ncbi:hypothetical protein PHYBLDRAFT_181547 [Phycomyces blakesleeanus NRRL 1555(-)]|uniref:F-box domain-containing protein n=1 Tax=Phycomyces blakesleeanus (strain ATCC 8743b / DSM 1359 / FGSC 10004 / NBRC 33097 / NRRL 1555) TaxID=763407 RepID=A0A162X9Z7_PHYB8|nr:hypothetical protein PHYBLDRAFT_181547 [Phycomyces blakesleeanus NRRL 1555(-)]OAD73455.1 hypothetical protein PHYBLDRAFT_181547 [Phycomyces blakesleeanus NRRL 1555(-)]|eukprot:XP_018291495.1 hypothetical protein PHYBLDRAFT_181547 [Phycomyces blakesleeanus NRRL 1555(-)]
MPITQLPPEVLSSIAEFLSKKDLLQGSLVCKKWRRLFYEKLWQDISIFDEKASNAVYNISPENKYLIYGQHVRNIYISNEYPVSSKNILVLQQLFPNTRKLSITLSYPEMIYTDTDTNCSVWRSMDNLSINFGDYINSTLIKPCSGILSQFAYVTTLDLSFSDAYTSGIGDFEGIHYYLPRLKHFSTKVKLARITEEDMNHINERVPAYDLTNISLSMYMEDLQWLYYFAVKYTNVRTLSLCPIFESGPLRDYNLGLTRSKLSMLPHVFSNLNKLVIRDVGYTSMLSLPLYECLYNGITLIKEWKYDYYIQTDEDQRLERTTAEIMRICSKTIESIIFEYTDPIDSPAPHDISKSFTDCPRLVLINIFNCGSCLQFDIIADCCPSLKELRLFGGGVYIGSEAMKSFKPHGLRVLNLNASSIDPDTLKYISVRCESLSHVWLRRLSVFGTISADTGTLLVDMSSAKLTELRIGCLFYRTPAEIGSWDPTTEIDFMKLIRAVRPHHQMIESNERIDQSFPRNVVKYETETTWYNLFNRTDMPSSVNLDILKKPVVDYIEEYFENYRDNMISGKIQGIRISGKTAGICVPGEEELPQEYDLDLSRGYVKFMCGYVEHCYIHTMPKRCWADFYWDPIKNKVCSR